MTAILASRGISVTDEKVWLQDPTLSGGPADETGASFVNTAFAAAIARALTYTGNGKPVIAGKSGTYKWDTSKGGLGIPEGVSFTFGAGATQAAAIQFPTDTHVPAAVGFCDTGSTLGQTTVVVTHVKNTFPVASVSVPQPALMNGNLITYTGVSQVGATATLTGCVGVLAGTSYPQLVTAGAAVLVATSSAVRTFVLDKSVQITGPSSGSSAWATATPPAGFMDGIWVAGSAGIDCSVTGFRQNVMYAGDHETFGGHMYMGGGWCNFACESPLDYQWDNVDSGNQVWEGGQVLSGGAYWCHHYISACNQLLGATIKGQTHAGGVPWWMWKAASVGVTGGSHSIMSDVEIDSLFFEGLGLGIVGCPDDGSTINRSRFRGGAASFYDASIPSPYTAPVAAFYCPFDKMVLDGFGGLGFTSSSLSAGVPIFKTDHAIGAFTNMGQDFRDDIVAHPPAAITPGSSPTINVELDWGAITGGFVNAATAGDVLSVRTAAPFGSYHTAFLHERYDGVALRPVSGVALAAENVRILTQVQNRQDGPATANVRVRSTPPTSPAASVGGTAGTRPAGTHYYKIAALLSGGGETAASTEVSVALSGSNSASLTWVAPASIPHGQTVTGYRVHHGTSAGAENGYIAVGNVLAYTDSGAATTAGTPNTTNVGCEVYFTGLGFCYVRADSDGSTYFGKVCTATGPYDTAGPVIGQAFDTAHGGGADNGATVKVLILPALK